MATERMEGADPGPGSTSADERACARAMVACYTLMDLGDYEASAALFAEDATWVRGGTEVTGRADILAALRKRPPGAASRHLVTNVLITLTGSDSAEGVAYFMPLRASVGADGTGPLPPFTMVGDLTARFRRVGTQWLVTWLQPRPVFKAPG